MSDPLEDEGPPPMITIDEAEREERESIGGGSAPEETKTRGERTSSAVLAKAVFSVSAFAAAGSERAKSKVPALEEDSKPSRATPKVTADTDSHDSDDARSEDTQHRIVGLVDVSREDHPLGLEPVPEEPDETIGDNDNGDGQSNSGGNRLLGNSDVDQVFQPQPSRQTVGLLSPSYRPATAPRKYEGYVPVLDGDKDDEDRFMGWDPYGFHFEPEHREEELRTYEANYAAYQERVEQWEGYLSKVDLAAECARGSKRLKSLIRGGVPSHLRGQVWFETSGAAKLHAKHEPDYYNRLIECAAHPRSIVDPSTGKPLSEKSVASLEKAAQQIEADLPRTFPRHRAIDTPEGIAALRRVLTAYSVRNPRVGYCQSLNFIAAVALLFLPESRAFWLVAALSENLLQVYHTKQMTMLHVDVRVLQQLVEEKMPVLASHLQSNGLGLNIVCTPWLLTVYTASLPSEGVLRCWDALFSEGAKIMFRVGIAILKINMASLMACEDIGSIMARLRVSARVCHNADELMSVAFDGIGSLPMAKVRKLREVHHAELVREAKVINRRRKNSGAVRKSWMLDVGE